MQCRIRDFSGAVPDGPRRGEPLTWFQRRIAWSMALALEGSQS
jgi:hypothetical protein